MFRRFPYIALVAALAVLLALAFHAYYAFRTPAAPTSSVASEYPRGVMVRESDLGEQSDFNAGYLHQDGRIFYVQRVQFGTEDPDKLGFRYDKHEVQGADPGSFVALADGENSYPPFYYLWAQDQYGIYRDGERIEPAAGTLSLDLISFEILSYYFIRDSNGVYLVDYDTDEYRLLPVDAPSFTLVGEQCAMDANSFYLIDYYVTGLTKVDKVDAKECDRPGPGWAEEKA